MIKEPVVQSRYGKWYKPKVLLHALMKLDYHTQWTVTGGGKLPLVTMSSNIENILN
jgi:hypothetical protein